MKNEMKDHGNPQRDAFERELRARYVQASGHLSARTQVQLHNRLRAALAQEESPMGMRRPGWLLAAAGSLALVFAFGLQWQPGHEAMPTPAAPLVASGGNDNGELVAPLDETPDLYLWLASDDATALASE